MSFRPVVRAARSVAPAILCSAVLMSAAVPARAARVILELDPAAAPGRRAAVLSALSTGAGTAPAYAPLFAGHTAPADPLSRFVVVDVAGDAAAEALAARASREAGVLSAERDRAVALDGCVPDDPYFNHASPDSMQWPLHANPAGPDLGALEAWGVTQGDGVILAVLDSGVDWHHPDFGAPLDPAGAIWINAAEVNGQPGVDDDGNGFVDDVRGWDFVDVATINGESALVDTLEDGYVPDNDPADWDGHGTVVAGIIGARADDGIGAAGAAPGCRIMPVRVGWHRDYRDNLNRRVQEGVTAMSFCAQAIVYATDNGARVLNCSWNSDQTVALTAALDYAIIDRGVVVVDAAGNGGLSETQDRNYLSRRGDCIEVAALRKNGGISAVTSLGSWIDIAAPGERLLTLQRLGKGALYAITTQGATSFAAPFVTAVAGLAVAVDPSLTPPQVRQLVRTTAVNIDGLDVNSFYRGKYGAGLVSALGVTSALSGRARFAGHAPPAASPAVLDDGRCVTFDANQDLLTLSVSGAVFDSVRLSWATGVAGLPAAAVTPGGLVRAVSFRSGHVLVMDEDGAPRPGWPRPVGGFLFTGPVLADLSGDGTPEVVAAGTDSLLHAWDLDGRPVPGFPVRLSGAVTAPIAAGDLDGDGRADVVAVTARGFVQAVRSDGSTLSGWPVRVAGAGRRAPLLCDALGISALQVFVPEGSRVHGFRADATPLAGWPVTGAGEITGLAAARMTGTGASVFAVEDGRRVHRLGGTGVESAGWPVDPGADLAGAPIAVGLHGTVVPELLTMTKDGCLTAWDAAGTSSNVLALAGTAAAPAAGGFEQSGAAALWIHGDDGVVRRVPVPDVVHLPRSLGMVFWLADGGDAGRTRTLTPLPDVTVPRVPAPAPATRVLLTPNPTHGAGRFHLSLEKETPGTLLLFDIQGRPVRRLFEGTLPAGESVLEWDGADDSGRPLASGIYGYRFRWPGGSVSGRLIRLR